MMIGQCIGNVFARNRKFGGLLPINAGSTAPQQNFDLRVKNLLPKAGSTAPRQNLDLRVKGLLPKADTTASQQPYKQKV